MANTKCKNCDHEISVKAAACPKCGHPNEAKQQTQVSGGAAIFIILIAIGAAWYFYGGGLERHAGNEMQKIHNQVASDAVKQYNIAKRQGDPMQIYVQAGFVAAAYLQAGDEANYQKWKKIEKQAGKKAGLTQETP